MEHVCPCLSTRRSIGFNEYLLESDNINIRASQPVVCAGDAGTA
jgi:hypothetical protein